MAQTEGASVAVVGAGNWGSSLIAALRKTGLEPAEVVGQSGWQRAKLDARIIWLCVPDTSIAGVAEKLASRASRLRGGDALRGQIVVHSSGALSADVLEPARRAGAKIASVHPVMSFPTRRVVPLQGVMFGIEAQEGTVRRELSSLVRRIGGAPFPVGSDSKALYHAAGVLASPLLVSALTAAIETARLAQLDQKTATQWVQALAEATVANVFARGPQASFSGPFARGDAATITLHLRALAEHPILGDVYRALARHAIATLPVKNHSALLTAIGEADRSRTLK